MTARIRPLISILIINYIFGTALGDQYLGKFIGKLSELHHGVSGEVYAVDARTLHIKDFTYDGQGPAAYFYAGNTKVAGNSGFRLRDESGSGDVIRKYRKEHVTLSLPEGKTLNNIKIFYVWCEEFAVNFGDVKISRNFDYPKPQKIDGLQGVHGISSDHIVIVDAQTLLIPNLSYDGEAPDAKFWVGHGPKPSPQGIRVPDENGKIIPLRRYDKKTIVLTLPGDLTAFDIGHFGIWCEAFTVDFGHVLIPQNLNVPPSLRMLGVSPQSKLNCEILYDDLAFEVRWAVAGDSVVLQLVAKLDDREYMSFGISGDERKSVMVNGDVAVAWVDKTTSKGYAQDYYLDAKSQCSGPTGSCPDSKLGDHTQNVRLLNAAMVNGYSIVTYQRPLRASDEFDKPIITNQSQPIIWAIGPLNQRDEVSFHSQYTKGDKFLNFGRVPKWNCPMPETEQPSMKRIPTSTEVAEEVEVTKTTAPTRSRNPERRRGGSANRGNNRQEITNDNERSSTRTRPQSERRGSNRNSERGNTRNTSEATRLVPTPASVSKRNAWEIPAIKCDEPEDGVFYAQMGPTGGKRGYPAITGHVGWGISWYINGLLIPEINVVRGKQYTFVVEGGFDSEVPAKYHPFYITDDPIGGYEYKTDEEKKSVRIFAGAQEAKDRTLHPTGTGRLCHWTQQGDNDADDFESFGAYQRTLELKCDKGEPGVIQWTPDNKTPDTVYYQCFTHRYLGWKINVLDACDEQTAASETKTIIVPAPVEEEMDKSESIRVETVVKTNHIPIDASEDKVKSTVSAFTDPPVVVAIPNGPILKLDEQPLYTTPQHYHFIPQVFYTNSMPISPQNIYTPYQFQYPSNEQLNFRPSPSMNLNTEEMKLTSPKLFSDDVTTTNSVPSTSTDVAIATTAISTENTIVHVTDNPEARQTLITVTPPIAKSLGTIRSAPIKLTMSHPPRPIYPRNTMHFPKTHNRPIMLRSKPPPMNVGFKSPYYIPFKKTVRRPPMMVETKLPPIYYMHKGRPKTKLHSAGRPSNFVVLTPQMITKAPHIVTAKPPQTLEQIRNIEISPQQLSTEKEPELQTAKTVELTSKPSNTLNIPILVAGLQTSKPLEVTPERFGEIRIRPALNTGFHPETVKIESGFKPIMSQEFQDRIEENHYDTIYNNNLGLINIDDNPVPVQDQIFEPMFFPSPIAPIKKLSKINKSKNMSRYSNKNSIKVTFKFPRALPRVNDTIPEASNVESYYLPPAGEIKIPVTSIQGLSIADVPSHIPAKPLGDTAPDVVVTYDGRKVSGASLTARLSDSSSALESRSSIKASDILRARPQFVPFKGELPPLDSINPGLQTSGIPPKGFDSDQSQLTKLSPVGKGFRGSEKRRKRAAHHTPEHTLEQIQEKITNKPSSTNTLHIPIHIILLSAVVSRI